MRMTVGFYSALVIAGIFGLGCAEGPGREWTSLDEADTSLIFTAPGLDATAKRFMRSNAVDYSDSWETGVWASPVSIIPKAQMMLQKLSPGYVYTSDMDIEQYIKSLPFTKNKNPSIGTKQSGHTGIGEIIYRSFSFDNLECIAFGQNFGNLAVDDLVRSDLMGSNILSGYYCGDPGQELSPDAIGRAINSIGVKG